MHTEERLHALDAVRGFALIAGVVLHATMSFLPGLGAQGWPISDNSPSVALGLMFYVIHIFRMTTFFLIAGFFGRLLLHRSGVREFVANRSTRVLIPLVVGWIVFFPMVATAMVWAAGGEATPPREIMRRTALTFPLAHLWFLYVLSLMYAGTLVLRQGVVERLDPAGRLRAWVDRRLSNLTTWSVLPLALATPLVAVLAASPAWGRWFGIPTPDSSLIPNAPAMMAFATAFVFGWLLQRQPALLHTFERRWAVHLALAVALTGICLSITGLAPEFTQFAGRSTIGYVVAYALSVWCWTFAILGIALRFCAGASPVRRYVADASYWIYLAHLPLVFWLQVAVKDLPWHWSVKFAVVMTSALAILFITYHVLVRYTLIGETLNGRRLRRAHTTPAEHESRSARPHAEPGDASALATLSNVRKSYGKTMALDGLSLDVRPGELLAVLGPNGAGKSTAISLMLGLQEPDSGSAALFGVSPQRVEARSHIGVMMQEASLAPELRVRELIDLTSSYYTAPLTVAETLELTHTLPLAHRPYGKLSAGQKRQVQFALAVCGRPLLLFLDEPTVGLDVQARETLWAALRQLVARGSSIVLTTHYLEEAEALANRVAVLAKGRLIASGSVDEMRSLVARKRIRCTTVLTPDLVKTWPGVISASIDGGYLQVVAADADAVVRRILTTDAHARDLEVQRAGLAEAFTELTQEAA